jgi:hypothetical protein
VDQWIIWLKFQRRIEVPDCLGKTVAPHGGDPVLDTDRRLKGVCQKNPAVDFTCHALAS